VAEFSGTTPTKGALLYRNWLALYVHMCCYWNRLLWSNNRLRLEER
jgi:hypothetical protein